MLRVRSRVMNAAVDGSASRPPSPGECERGRTGDASFDERAEPPPRTATGSSSGVELLEALDLCALVVTETMRIVEANACGREALAGRDGLVPAKRDALGAELPEDGSALADCVAEACRGGTGGSVLVQRSAAGRPLLVRVAPFSPVSGSRTGLALICFRAPAARLKHRRQVLSALFRLSAAEVQVALDLAEGDDLTQIADRRGVQLSTVRSQVGSLMSKTGTRRQAELVALIAGLAADGV